MRAWYLGKVTDPRAPNKLIEVDLESLKGLGVECFKFDADRFVQNFRKILTKTSDLASVD